MSVAFELVTTHSGALAVRDLETGEVMHPNGPSIEAERLYVAPSKLRARLSERGDALHLLDVGLGAGTNGLAAWRASELRSDGRALEIVSFERTLEPLQLALRNPQEFGLAAHECEVLCALMAGGATGANTRWTLRLSDLRAEMDTLPAASADVVFWDPYSPRVQPALWGVESFRALRRACAPGATVHTYSAATSVRAALLLAGFAVGFGPALGEKQKRSTLAATDVSVLEAPLPASWLLGLSDRALPYDAPANALERLREIPQLR